MVRLTIHARGHRLLPDKPKLTITQKESFYIENDKRLQSEQPIHP